MKDGFDLRETLRNWHTGDLYVKEVPPSRGSVEIVVFLFEDPLDEEEYSWRSTWFAEHAEESTLCFFATPYRNASSAPEWRCRVMAARSCSSRRDRSPMCGRTTGWRSRARRPIAWWRERCCTRASGTSCWSRRGRRGPRWRLAGATLAERKILYIPLQRFSGQTVERLRHFHVLNGREVRTWAGRFVRTF